MSSKFNTIVQHVLFIRLDSHVSKKDNISFASHKSYNHLTHIIVWWVGYDLIRRFL